MVKGQVSDKRLFPPVILNWINGGQRAAASEESFSKLSPHDGSHLCLVTRSQAGDVETAIAAAREAQPKWADMPPVKRGVVLHDLAMALRENRGVMAQIVALETGKSFRSALGETDGAVALGLFMAGEGQRLYGRTTTSETPNKYAMTVRQPLGIAGLIIAANTPIANIAWKVFPALICGNAAVLKAPEDAPATAWEFGRIALDAGLPGGVLSIIQGYGPEAGAALVANPRIDVLSFTGSTTVGRKIAVKAGERLARVSLELGGKNPLIVCDDADLENAVHWSLLSAFSNAGQRCAAASRLIIFNSVYEEFREMLIERTKQLRVGPGDDDDFGPVINESQLTNMLAAIGRARQQGAVIVGGHRLTDPHHRDGFYLEPTLIENVDPYDQISTTELFGPIACLYRVADFAAALALANDSPYGLTACIHTRSLHRAIQFAQKVDAGVAVVNAGTFGSEAHMPFGGVKQSGNGTREPGTEALDVYSSLKDVYLNVDINQL